MNDVKHLHARRIFLRNSLAASLLLSTGCTSRKTTSSDLIEPELIIGRRGLSEGRFQKPRAMAMDANDELYVVDKTGRIQVFSSSGDFLRGWTTPAIANGKPTGLSISNDGLLMVADTHYFRILFYSRDGKLLDAKTLGGSFGPEKGQMAFVTDCVQDKDRSYYVSEYGAYDRIQKYTPDGKFITQYGEHGDGPNQFSRPQSLAIDESGQLWVADSCNHRIKILDWNSGDVKVIKTFGGNGHEPGQFRYPYGIHLTKDALYVAEYAGHRVQKFDRQLNFVASFGKPGNELSDLNAPWSVVKDSKGALYVVDSGNNRVVKFRF
jgi:sugar lactone lactonase YvrE